MAKKSGPPGKRSPTGNRPRRPAAQPLVARPSPTVTEKSADSAGPMARASFPVVGVGASAGGLEAFTDLLGALPAATGMAFVLVQHLDPTHESILPKLLTRATSMPVHEVRDGMAVQPNHVYVIPPNARMTISDGLLRLSSRVGQAGIFPSTTSSVPWPKICNG